METIDAPEATRCGLASATTCRRGCPPAKLRRGVARGSRTAAPEPGNLAAVRVAIEVDGAAGL